MVLACAFCKKPFEADRTSHKAPILGLECPHLLCRQCVWNLHDNEANRTIKNYPCPICKKRSFRIDSVPHVAFFDAIEVLNTPEQPTVPSSPPVATASSNSPVATARFHVALEISAPGNERAITAGSNSSAAVLDGFDELELKRTVLRSLEGASVVAGSPEAAEDHRTPAAESREEAEPPTKRPRQEPARESPAAVARAGAKKKTGENPEADEDCKPAALTTEELELKLAIRHSLEEVGDSEAGVGDCKPAARNTTETEDSERGDQNNNASHSNVHSKPEEEAEDQKPAAVEPNQDADRNSDVNADSEQNAGGDGNPTAAQAASQAQENNQTLAGTAESPLEVESDGEHYLVTLQQTIARNMFDSQNIVGDKDEAILQYILVDSMQHRGS